MKKILFDFITFEDKIINGGALYAQTVLCGLLEKGCNIYGLCKDADNLNSEIKILIDKFDIKIISIKKGWVEYVNQIGFDTFFIAIAQRFNRIDLTGIKCKICIVCHDIVDIVLYRAGLYYNYQIYNDIFKITDDKHPKLSCYKVMAKRIIKEKSILGIISDKNLKKRLHYSNFENLIKQKNVFIITVSNYTKNSLEYFFDDIANPIKVFYCPVIKRDYDNQNVSDQIENVIKGKKYFLILSANRYNKNFSVFADQFVKFNRKMNDEFRAVVVGAKKIKEEGFIPFYNVNDLELKKLLQNAYCLVYPTLGEGFGLPPIEAMSYGTPVIVSYNTSIPEIYGNEILYFNPCYREDLFAKEFELVNNYERYTEIANRVAKKVIERQNEDFDKLIENLMNV